MSTENRQVRRIEGTTASPALVENKQIKFDVGVNGITDDTKFIYQDSAGTQHTYITIEETNALIAQGLNTFVSYDADSDSYTLDTTADGQTQNLGQEIFYSAFNDNAAGATALNPKAFFITGSKSGEEQWKTVHLAVPEDLGNGTIFGLNTTSMGVGEYGKISTYGEVKDVNTTGFSVGETLYLDETNGDLTNVLPIENIYVIGIVTKVHATEGIIFANTIAGARSDADNDTIRNMAGSLNGIVPHKPKVVFYDGGTDIIYAEVTDEIRPTKNLQYLVGQTQYELNTLTGDGPNGGARVQLPFSADPAVLETVFLYINHNGGSPILAAETSFPFADNASLGTIEIRDYDTTVSEGVFGWRRSNDAVDNGDSDGINRWITDAIRIKLGTTWFSGCVGTPTVDNTQIRLATSSGNVVQMHVQGFEAQDGLSYWVYNDEANETYYDFTDNLTSITQDALGQTFLSNGLYYRLGIFALNNSPDNGDSGSVDRLLVTRPLGSYTLAAEALLDTNNYDVDISDTATEGLITQLYTLVIARTGASGATITLLSLQDNRSRLVGKNTGVGGSASAGGLTLFTELNDTPTTYTGQAGKIATVNGVESALEFIDPVWVYEGDDKVLYDGSTELQRVDENGNIFRNGAFAFYNLNISTDYIYDVSRTSVSMQSKLDNTSYLTNNVYKVSTTTKFGLLDLSAGKGGSITQKLPDGTVVEYNIPDVGGLFFDIDEYETRRVDPQGNVSHSQAEIPNDVDPDWKHIFYEDGVVKIIHPTIAAYSFEARNAYIKTSDTWERIVDAPARLTTFNSVVKLEEKSTTDTGTLLWEVQTRLSDTAIAYGGTIIPLDLDPLFNYKFGTSRVTMDSIESDQTLVGTNCYLTDDAGKIRLIDNSYGGTLIKIFEGTVFEYNIPSGVADAFDVTPYQTRFTNAFGDADIDNDLSINAFLRLDNGGSVNEFSTDGTLSDNSNIAIPTENAVKTYVDDHTSSVNIEFFGASTGASGAVNRQAIQDAIDFTETNASVASVFIPEGTYFIDDYVEMGSNTKLVGANGATLKAENLTMDLFITNKNELSGGGYTGDKKINIENINFDANRTTTGQNITIIGIAHATNVKIINCEFTKWSEWHAIELNACSDSLITGCKFYDAIQSDLNEEAIQLDLATSIISFPWSSGAPYDNTPCKNIIMSDCTFENVSTGIGTHNFVTNTPVDGIIIRDCVFNTIKFRCVSAYNWSNLLITGCTVYDAERFVNYFGVGLTIPGIVSGIKVVNNSIELVQYGLNVDQEGSINVHGVTDGIIFSNNILKNITKVANNSRALWVQGESSSRIHNVIANGNTVDGVSQYGITADYCTDIIFSNNKVTGCEQSGIVMFSCNNGSITDNVSNNNNTDAGSYYDVNYYSNGTDGLISGNNCETINVQDVTNTYVTGNKIDTALTLAGATNKSNANYIAGVWTI